MPKYMPANTAESNTDCVAKQTVEKLAPILHPAASINDISTSITNIYQAATNINSDISNAITNVNVIISNLGLLITQIVTTPISEIINNSGSNSGDNSRNA